MLADFSPYLNRTDVRVVVDDLAVLTEDYQKSKDDPRVDVSVVWVQPGAIVRVDPWHRFEFSVEKKFAIAGGMATRIEDQQLESGMSHDDFLAGMSPVTKSWTAIEVVGSSLEYDKIHLLKDRLRFRLGMGSSFECALAMSKSLNKNVSNRDREREKLIAAKGLETLRDLTTESEFRRFVTRGFLEVKTQKARYRIDRFGSLEVIDRDRVVSRLCIHTDDTCPKIDHIINLKLLLEMDEEAVWQGSNVRVVNANGGETTETALMLLAHTLQNADVQEARDDLAGEVLTEEDLTKGVSDEGMRAVAN